MIFPVPVSNIFGLTVASALIELRMLSSSLICACQCHDQHGRHGVTDSTVCSNTAHLWPPCRGHDVDMSQGKRPRLATSCKTLQNSTGSCQSSSSLLATTSLSYHILPIFHPFQAASICRLQPGHFAGGFLQAPGGAGRGPGRMSDLFQTKTISTHKNCKLHI